MSTYNEQLQGLGEEQQAAGPEPSYEEMGMGDPDVNMGMAERMTSVIGGAAMLASGVFLAVKRRPLLSAAMGLGAGMLLKRGVSGHCPLYGALGIQRSDTVRFGRKLSQGIFIEESVTINRPAEQLYAFWRDLKNLPRIMSHIERIDVVDDLKSRWFAEGPGGQLVEWEAVITRERPSELIAWKTTENAAVPNQGSVCFRPASGDRGTIVEVVLQYYPPAGKLGAAMARLFRRDPAQEIRDDLEEFKASMEAGAEPEVSGQPAGTFAAGI